MDDFFKIDLSQMSVINFFGLVFFGVLIYAVMWLFKNYLVHFFIKSPVRRKKVIIMLPVIFTIIWVLFTFYSLYVFITPFPLFGIIISLIAVYFGKGYILNLINGLFFRLKGDINLGQKISIDEHSGIVHKMNVFDMEIENREGVIIQIPYGNLAKTEIEKKDFSTDFSSYKFSIIVSEDITSQIIKTRLMQMPWITTVFSPKVSKTMQSEGKISYDIIVYALDEKFFSHIENDLKTSLS